MFGAILVYYWTFCAKKPKRKIQTSLPLVGSTKGDVFVKDMPCETKDVYIAYCYELLVTTIRSTLLNECPVSKHIPKDLDHLLALHTTQLFHSGSILLKICGQ